MCGAARMLSCYVPACAGDSARGLGGGSIGEDGAVSGDADTGVVALPCLAGMRNRLGQTWFLGFAAPWFMGAGHSACMHACEYACM